jgi:hypothetical protein
MDVDPPLRANAFEQLRDGGIGPAALDDLREEEIAQHRSEIVLGGVHRLPQRAPGRRLVLAHRLGGHERAEAHADPHDSRGARAPSSLGRRGERILDERGERHRREVARRVAVPACMVAKAREPERSRRAALSASTRLDVTCSTPSVWQYTTAGAALRGDCGGW